MCAQNQPFGGVLRKRCSENALQIYRRTPMAKRNFKKVALQLSLITLRHGRDPANLFEIFRTSFPKNTSGGLLLCVWSLITWSIGLSEKTKQLHRKSSLLFNMSEKYGKNTQVAPEWITPAKVLFKTTYHLLHSTSIIIFFPQFSFTCQCLKRKTILWTKCGKSWSVWYLQTFYVKYSLWTITKHIF